MSTEKSHKQTREAIERSLELKLKKVKEDEIKEKELRAAVRDLPHIPGTCPVSRCHEVVFPCNLMTHMLHKHMYKPNCITSEIYDHKPVVVCFDPTTFQHGENHCVATLVYGGVKDKSKTQPGLSLLSRPNAALISKNRKLVNYLPIMMMVCRTTWYAQLKDKELERQLVEMNGDKAVIYVVWLVTPGTTRKLNYTLTVYDRHYLNARSVVRAMRNYTANQNPSIFLPTEDNYLIMRESEVRDFIKSGAFSMGNKIQNVGIPMEVIVYENPTDVPVRHSSAKELQEAQQKLDEVYLEGSSSRLLAGGKCRARKEKQSDSGKVPLFPIKLSAEEMALEKLEDNALKLLEAKQRIKEAQQKREDCTSLISGSFASKSTLTGSKVKRITSTNPKSKSLSYFASELNAEEKALELVEDNALKRLHAKSLNSHTTGSNTMDDVMNEEDTVRLREEESSLKNMTSTSSILTYLR